MALGRVSRLEVRRVVEIATVISGHCSHMLVNICAVSVEVSAESPGGQGQFQPF